jgi:intein/homing endonuclease
MEIWKFISSLDNKYEVSNLGRVRSAHGRNKGKILKLYRKYPLNITYDFVELYPNKKRVIKRVHRLVAEAFCENLENYPIVMHLDNNIRNNKADNLQWGTLKMNSQQMINEGRGNKSRGSSHYLSKLTEDQVIEIRTKYIPRKYTLQQLAKEYNVSFSLIGHVVKNRNWTHVNL